MSSYFPFLIMRNIIYSENSESIHAWGVRESRIEYSTMLEFCNVIRKFIPIAA